MPDRRLAMSESRAFAKHAVRLQLPDSVGPLGMHGIYERGGRTD